MAATRVYIEQGGTRTFASAADWPGWCRAGRDEPTALESLASYAVRYARVAELAGIALPQDATNFNVIERLRGNATTDFGAPAVPAKPEEEVTTGRETDRMLALMDACWKYLDHVRAKSPQGLRKGPRGGGRDRDAMFLHVLSAEAGYGRHIGVRLREPKDIDPETVKSVRNALREGFKDPNRDAKWPVPYIIRRTAWHAVDHAWEMEDRLP